MEMIKKIKNPIVREIVDWGLHIGIAVVIALLITNFVFQRTVVYKKSMQPTLYQNDNLIVEKISPKIGNLDRGDIVTVYAPEYVKAKGNTMIKRIVALEGDTVKIENNKLYINGKILEEDYTLDDTTEPPEHKEIDLTVPKGHVYVLGDNRVDKIIDSREAGPIKIENVTGKAVLRIFPFSQIRTF